MSMFHQLMVKSWAAEQGKVDDLYAGSASHEHAKRLALRVFLVVVAVLFMLLLIAYARTMLPGALGGQLGGLAAGASRGPMDLCRGSGIRHL